MTDAPKPNTFLEETVQLNSSEVNASHDSGISETQKAASLRMELLTGSRGKLSDEIDQVTVSRLRLAALLFFFGNLMFLIYSLIWRHPHAHATNNFEAAVFWVHALITVVTGTVGMRFCVGHVVTGWQLRIGELLVFGGSAIFFAVVTASQLLNGADHGFIANMNGPWLILIFTYALFMPNSWRRATLVIIPMAFGPVLAMTFAWFYSEAFRQALDTEHFRDAFQTTFLAMGFAAAIAIYGVRQMRTLRTEAYEARQLGQYRLTKLIGSGGMGEVYEAEHLLLKRASAIKVIKADKVADVEVLKRFEREVRATAKLTHWNTVDIYDYGHSDDGTFYYVMELLHGMNLQELVDQHGPLPEARVIHLLSQTCDALSEAHAAGMVHRDIKPANIYAAEIGRRFDVAKLLDFGLVRPLATATNDIQLTQQNVILGSPLYMPPEQASGEAVDVRSDIYSLGVVAYFLLSGRTPFVGSNPLEVIMAHARKSAPPMDVDVSPAMDRIVMRCMEKEPDARYHSVEELQQELVKCDVAKDWSWDSAANWWQVNSNHKMQNDPRRS